MGLIPLAGFTAFMPLYASDELDISSGLIFVIYGVLILAVGNDRNPGTVRWIALHLRKRRKRKLAELASTIVEKLPLGDD